MIQQHSDLLAFGGKREQNKKMIDIERYWVNLNRPPVSYYVPYWVLQKLSEYTTSARLMNNPAQLFKLTNELLAPWGFKPLASGTNRRAFYCEYDPGIIFKIGFDRVGKTANLNEYYLQNMVRPFCSKVFNVTPDGLVSLSERVEEMTEHLYKHVWASDIFDFLVTLLSRGFIMDDVGTNFYKNLGIRMGFGPVLIDFADLYKLDPNKIKCTHRDPITHRVCGGEIDYNYDKGMSEIICTKCGARYSAKYLGEQVPAEVITRIETERKIDMTKDTWHVSIVKGDGTVVHDYTAETPCQQVSHKPQPNQTVVVIGGSKTEAKKEEPVQQQEVVTTAEQHNKNVVNPLVFRASDISNMTPVQQPVNQTTKTEVDTKIMQAGVVVDEQTYQAMCDMFGKESVEREAAPYRAAANAEAAKQVPGQVVAGPVVTKEMREATAGPIPMPERQTVQAANGQILNVYSPEEISKEYFKSKSEGKELPETILETAPEVTIDNDVKYNGDSTPMHTVGHVKEYEHYYVHGQKLFFYPKNVHSDLIMWLRRAEDKYGIDAVKLIAQKLEIMYVPKDEHDKATAERKKATQPKVVTTNTSAEKVETIIAPPKEQKLLNVEKPENWKTRTPEAPVKNDQGENKEITAEERPTENLFPVNPKTREEIEEEDAKQNAAGNVMGFPGTPVVDAIKFKNSMPILKKSVENLFGSIVLSQDAERQCEEIAQRIAGFIRKDVIDIMNDEDAKGLKVEVVRTVDNRNADCFNVKAFDYGTPLFETYIYPDNGSYDEQLKESIKEDPEAVFNPKLLADLFEGWVKEISSNSFTSIEEAKQTIKAFLFSKLHDHFKGKMTVARATKEAEDYVNNVINFNDAPAPVEEKAAEQNTVETQL